MLALAPWVGLAACAIWLLVAAIFRYSSLAALVAIGLSPLISSYMYDNENLAGVLGVITLLVYFKHRANLQRLFRGEEPKIGKKKPDAA